MSKRHHPRKRQNGRYTAPQRQLGRFYGIEEVPDGFVVYGDGLGEWLVYDPELVRAMQHDCPICNGTGDAP